MKSSLHVPKVSSQLYVICRSDLSVCEECYETLLLIATASEDGFTRLYESGVMRVLDSNISSLPDGIKYFTLLFSLHVYFLFSIIGPSSQIDYRTMFLVYSISLSIQCNVDEPACQSELINIFFLDYFYMVGN